MHKLIVNKIEPNVNPHSLAPESMLFNHYIMLLKHVSLNQIKSNEV